MRILQDVLWTCTLVADALLSLRICPVVAFWLLEPVNPKKAASEKDVRIDQEKVTAFQGFCNMVNASPQVALSYPVEVAGAIASLCPPPPQLFQQLQQILASYKQARVDTRLLEQQCTQSVLVPACAVSDLGARTANVFGINVLDVDLSTNIST
eukprot:g31130.t1